ncbi:MAG: DUF5916 domain-containing protein [Longimicrobiales bacterium]
MSPSPVTTPSTRAVRLLAQVGVALLMFFWVPAAAQAQAPGYRVQVGAQEDRAEAAALQEAVANQLRGEHGVYVVEAGGFHKVRIGDFITRAEAGVVLARVKGLGYSDAWVAADEIQTAAASGGGGAPQPRPAPEPVVEEVMPEVEVAAAAGLPADAPTDVPTADEVAQAAEAELAEAERAAADLMAAAEENASAAWPLVDDDAIRLDGRPTERAWEEASAGWAKRPAAASGSAPSASVQFAYDTRAFYVATEVTHKDAAAIEGVRLDAPGDQERVVISVQRNGTTTSSFGVTATGVRIDYDAAGGDQATEWQARTSIEMSGWSSEIRIPFELLNVQDAGDAEWEVSVRWEDPKGAPTAGRMDLPMQQFAMVFGGSLGAGLSDDPAFVIAPFYQASTAVATATPAWGTPDSRVGGELKADLGEEFRAHAQVMPDYLNTRPDPARVNLSPYETRFEEQRGFYRGLDADMNAWAPGWGPSLFYSRRVGGVPAAAALPGSVETLGGSDVMGVASFEGKVNDVSYQALGSMTRTTKATILDTSGAPQTFDLVPQSFIGAGRVEHQVSGTAALGATVTGVTRSMAPGHALRDVLMDHAFTGTVDMDVAMGPSARFQAFASLSHLLGSTAAIQNLQLSSAHYLQRPDADHVALDPAATSMTGFAGGFAAEVEQSGVRFMGRAMARNPEYNIQDAGFMRTADRIEGEAFVGWGHRQGQEDGLPVGLEVGAYSDWNFAGIRLRTSPEARVLASSNGWEGQGSFRMDLEGFSSDLTRGGPIMATPQGWLASGQIQNQNDVGLFRAAGEYGTDDLGGSLIQGRVLGSADVAPGVSLWLEPGYFTLVNPRQYLMNLTGGVVETYGQRLVFGELDQTELFARVGMNLQLKYGLQLVGYVEPFVSSGEFTNFGELIAAPGNELLRYGTGGTTITPGTDGENLVDVGGTLFTIPASDFNVRSFRSQVSLGWTPVEYATLTLSWLQTRSAFANQFGSPGVGNLWDAATDFGSHLFVARVGYQLGIPR